jgi:NAD-dependent deacetylase
MEKMFPVFTLITQNVDRLHQTAGSKRVIELHGNIIENHCLDCKKPYIGETILPDKQLPRCSYCGGMIRPSVVWFGEMLPVGAIDKAVLAANDCDVFFSVGTSSEVYPAAHLPTQALRSGAYLVEVNPNKTALTINVDDKLAEPSGIALPALLEEFKKYKIKMEQK